MLPNSHPKHLLERPGHGGRDETSVFDAVGPTKTLAAKDVQPAKADHLSIGKETKQETRKTGSSTSAAIARSPCYKEIPNMELAKKAVAVICDIDEEIIQLVIDADRLQLDPSLTFSSSASLSEVVQEIALNPQRLEGLRAKVSHAQQHQQEKDGVEMDGEAATSGATQVIETEMQKKQNCGAAGAENSEVTCPSEMMEVTKVFPPTTTPACSSTFSSPSASGESPTKAAVGSSSKSKMASSESVPAPAPTPKAELQQRLKVLSAENRKLKHRKFCRACKKVDLADSGVTFLPCGHFITCEECSETFDDCPACGISIMGTVRTYLS